MILRSAVSHLPRPPSPRLRLLLCLRSEGWHGQHTRDTHDRRALLGSPHWPRLPVTGGQTALPQDMDTILSGQAATLRDASCAQAPPGLERVHPLTHEETKSGTQGWHVQGCVVAGGHQWFLPPARLGLQTPPAVPRGSTGRLPGGHRRPSAWQHARPARCPPLPSGWSQIPAPPSPGTRSPMVSSAPRCRDVVSQLGGEPRTESSHEQWGTAPPEAEIPSLSQDPLPAPLPSTRPPE